MTEPEAKAEFGEGNITVKKAKFTSMGYALQATAESKVKTGLKLVLCGAEERVSHAQRRSHAQPCSSTAMQRYR